MSPGPLHRLISRPEVQARLARIPLLRALVHREGEEIFDLVQGFVRSQVLYALVALGVLDRLGRQASGAVELANATGLTEDRMALLMRAGIGIGVLKPARGNRVRLSRKGAALIGVPGLTDMILHHRAFYADMADPVALLRGDGDTELSAFWPYVHGAAAAEDPETAARYSDLMARSQALVAEEALQSVSLSGVRTLLDIGGGAGAFLIAAGRRVPDLRLRLFELPAVLPLARRNIEGAGMADRFEAVAGSFRDEALPRGADAVSLIRVLYDHDDDTVRDLLGRVHAALPPGGRLIISEPMSGGDAPDPATDVYFAFYTLAMKTGRTRAQAEIAAMCRDAGFSDLRTPRPRRPFVTSVVTAVRP